MKNSTLPVILKKLFFNSFMVCLLISSVIIFIIAPDVNSLDVNVILLNLFALSVVLSIVLLISKIIIYDYFVQFALKGKMFVLIAYLAFFISLMPTVYYGEQAINRIDRVSNASIEILLAIELGGYGRTQEEVIDLIEKSVEKYKLSDAEQDSLIQALSEFMPELIEAEARARTEVYEPTSYLEIWATIAGLSLLYILGTITLTIWGRWKLRKRAGEKQHPFFDGVGGQRGMVSSAYLEGRDRSILRLLRAAKVLVASCSWLAVLSTLLCILVSYTRGWEAMSVGVDAATAAKASAALVAFLCVWMFASGRKQTILFLRKFGDREANDIVKLTIENQFRSKFRLFVLDDSTFAASALPWKERLNGVFYVAPFIILFFIFCAFVKIHVGPNYEHLSTISDYITGEVAKNPNPPINPYREETVILQGNPFFDFPYSLYLWAWALVLFAPLGMILLTSLSGNLRISGQVGIGRLRARMAWASNWLSAPNILAPMSTLVSTDAAVWKETVEAILKHCDLVIMDLSHDTDSLRWELAAVKRLAAGKSIFVARERDKCAGDDKHLADEFRIEPVYYLSSEDQSRLAAHLSGLTVLAPSRMINS